MERSILGWWQAGKRLAGATTLLALALTVGCGTSVEQAPNEPLGTTQSPLSVSDSLVIETRQGWEDTIQASVIGLDDRLGTKNQGGLFAVARYNAARNSLGVQLWELKDQENAPGSMVFMKELTTPVSSVARVYAASLGPFTSDPDGKPDWTYRFVVATRESTGMKLRTYLASEGWTSPTEHIAPDLQLMSPALSTGEAVVNIAITPVFQARDITAPLQFATATTNSAGQLKVITWLVDTTTGQITRKSTIITGDTVSWVAAAAPVSPYGMFTTASILSGSQRLKVTAWQVAGDGTLTKKNSYEEAGSLTQITASSAGYGRIAVAFNDRGGAGAKLANFEIDPSVPSWNVTRVQEADLGSGSNDPKSVFIAAGGAGRVFLTGDTATPSTTVRSWSVSANLTQIDDGFAHISDRQVTSAAVLKGDRLVVASITSAGELELQAWRDFYAPLARGEWMPTNMNNCPVKATVTSGAPADAMTETPRFPNHPAVGSAERLIASSPRFVVTCGTSACSFSDKAGNELGTIPLCTIFNGLEFELLRNIEAQYPCDPRGSTVGCPKSSSTYDSRVLYSQQVGRFVIVTHLRGDDSNGRHLAWAVSKTEDLRDGFWTYANLESIKRDDPKAAAAGGVLMISTDGLGDSPLDDDLAASWKPAVQIFDLNDLATNASFIKNTKLPGTQVTGPQLGSGNNHMPVHFSQPRVINGSSPNQTIIPSDLSFFYQPITGRLFAYWKDVEGPVTVYSHENPLPNVESENNSEYEAFYSKEVSDGVFEADFVRVGVDKAQGLLKVQDIGMRLQRGVGITDVFPEARDIACPGCERPTPATYGGKILIAFKQDHTGNVEGYDAKYMYLRSIFAIPNNSTLCALPGCTIGLVQQGDAAAATLQPQNYLIAPDGGNSFGGFKGFWLTHSYSCGGKPCPVAMRVLPH